MIRSRTIVRVILAAAAAAVVLALPSTASAATDLCDNLDGVQASLPSGHAGGTVSIPPYAPRSHGNYGSYENLPPGAPTSLCVSPSELVNPAMCGNLVGRTQPEGFVQLIDDDAVLLDGSGVRRYARLYLCVPLDACLDIEGVQPSIPAGYIASRYALNGCEPEPGDACPDLAGYQNPGDECDPLANTAADACYFMPGVQTSVPDGYQLLTNPSVPGNPWRTCVPIDRCDNLPGAQRDVPAGYALGPPWRDYPVDYVLAPGFVVPGTCTNPDTCTNLDGVQTTVPEGHEPPDAAGRCAQKPLADQCVNLAGNQTSVPRGLTQLLAWKPTVPAQRSAAGLLCVVSASGNASVGDLDDDALGQTSFGVSVENSTLLPPQIFRMLLMVFSASATVTGSNRNDWISTNALGNRIAGVAAAKHRRIILRGGAGHDYLGGVGVATVAQRLEGGPGNDLLDGASRNPASRGPRQVLLGGPGHDLLFTSNGRGGDIADCGPGRDVAVIDAGDRPVGCERVLVDGWKPRPYDISSGFGDPAQDGPRTCRFFADTGSRAPAASQLEHLLPYTCFWGAATNVDFSPRAYSTKRYLALASRREPGRQ